MSQWLGAILLVAGFVVLLQLLGVTKRSNDVVRISLHSIKILGSSKLSDAQKESKLQKNSLRLFGLFFVLAFCGAIAILIPLGVLWLGDRLGWLSLAASLEVTLSPMFIAASSILAVIAFLLKSKQKPNRTAPTSSYSPLDQTLHRVAFNTYTAQVALADLEDNIFARQLAKYKNEKPVFITALPRAGTTLLLECCANSPEFAAHRYRDMPFVLVPCLWNRFSQVFQGHVESTERAHGDGMQISLDSHEALEEIAWKTFWQRHYQSDRIIPWDYEENREFKEFFASHQRKILWLRRQNLANSARYVSKNNANIARPKMLHYLFPDSTIIVPFRDPLQHSYSLLKQHLNFGQIHQADPFASEYMKSIGHFDFGENLRPIDFDGWFDRRKTQDPKSLGFWLEYWTASYQHLLNENANIINFFDYDELCNNPHQGLLNLAEIVESCNPTALVSSASRIRSSPPREIEMSIPASITSGANSVYAQLRDRSVNS